MEDFDEVFFVPSDGAFWSPKWSRECAAREIMPGTAGEITRRWTSPAVYCHLEPPTGEWGSHDGDGVCKFEGSTRDNQKFIHTGPMN